MQHRLLIRSHACASYLLAKGHWPTDWDGQSFVFVGNSTLVQDANGYVAARDALNALIAARLPENGVRTPVERAI